MACYLIHFDRPYKHSRHYLGFADDVDARLERHRSGHGSQLMEVITDAGITWQLARTWTGDRKFERRLKNRKDAPHICPICSGEAANNRAKEKAI